MDDEITRLEAERQLAEASARHREAIATLEQQGRPATAETAAVRAAARGVALVTYALRRGRAAGVGPDRLAELSGWSPDLVEEALERGPDPIFARLIPADDREAVVRASAAATAIVAVDQLLEDIRDSVHDPDWSPAAADLDDLRDRLDMEWKRWRDALGRTA